MKFKSAVAPVVAFLAAAGIAAAPIADAATVIGVEGIFMPPGKSVTAFNGSFCKTNTCQNAKNPVWPSPTSVSKGADLVQASVQTAEGKVILLGWSQGAATNGEVLRRWAASPDQAPEADRVFVVNFGNPEHKYGSDDKVGPKGAGGIPIDTPFETLEINAQYDTVSDKPTRWGWYSMINTALNRHFSYFEIDPNDPENLVYQEGNVTYMLVKADVLPMLKWMDPFVSDERMAELDAKYRPLVEKDYDRPAYVEQGEGAKWEEGIKPDILKTPEPTPEIEEVEESEPKKTIQIQTGVETSGGQQKDTKDEKNDTDPTESTDPSDELITSDEAESPDDSGPETQESQESNESESTDTGGETA